MQLMQVTILFFVAIAGGAVVLTREPAKQAVGISFYGLLLAVMFFLYQAPDVALSQVVVGAVVLPLIILLTLTRIKIATEERESEQQQDKNKDHEKSKQQETA